MTLISTTNLLTFTDYLGACHKKLLSVVGGSADVAAPVLGTLQKTLSRLETLITTTVADYQQQADMLAGVHTSLLATNAQAVSAQAFKQAVTGLANHIQGSGSTVDATITNLGTYLTYYDTALGGSLFNKLVTPDFNRLWLTMATGVTLPPAGIMSPAIHPTFNPSASVNGLAKRIIGSSIVLGDAVDDTLYCCVVPILEVTTTFANGSAPPAYVITGVDHLGNAAATWTVTLTGNNPTSVYSSTITPAVVAQARQTVAVGSLTGCVAGSVLTVNSGLSDEEVIVVESVGGGAITAAFQLAHGAGAAITGFYSYALTPVNGARIKSVSAIAPSVTGTDTGQVRIVGRQDRVGV